MHHASRDAPNDAVPQSTADDDHANADPPPPTPKIVDKNATRC